LSGSDGEHHTRRRREHSVDWDLVLCYRDLAGNADAWRDFVTAVVERHGHQLDSIQVKRRTDAGAGIGSTTPLRVCENGWPTGPDRSEARQADVLEAVLRAVHARSDELNVTHWELFTLRDADSSNHDLFHNFGVLHHDYSRKPEFDRLVGLFKELG